MRRWLRVLWAILAAIIVVPVVGGFFAELAKERGWYVHPTGTVEAVMNWLSHIALHPAYLGPALFVTGVAVGLWLDAWARRYDERKRIWRKGIAILDFGDSSLVSERRKIESEMAKLKARLDENGLALVFEGDFDKEKELKRCRSTMTQDEYRLDAAHRRVFEHLFADVHRKLETGELLARGFAAPIAKGAGIVLIPKEQWHFLRISADYAKAMGGGIEYLGLHVAESS